mmetsp:Transcript_36998/g.80600  ORF Transcript_36998/g.80600 Transcript_36998/m.80600 type:complete len:456 (-) Transcript_36998:1-1368(-)
MRTLFGSCLCVLLISSFLRFRPVVAGCERRESGRFDLHAKSTDIRELANVKVAVECANERQYLQQFRFDRGVSLEVFYEYTCCGIPQSSPMPICSEETTTWDEPGDSMHYLDRHHIQCPSDFSYVNSFRLEASSLTRYVRYVYKCCKIPSSLGSCVQLNTPGGNDGNEFQESGALVYLDRHNIVCPTDNEFLSKWILTHPREGDISYQYECCEWGSMTMGACSVTQVTGAWVPISSSSGAETLTFSYGTSHEYTSALENSETEDTEAAWSREVETEASTGFEVSVSGSGFFASVSGSVSGSYSRTDSKTVAGSTSRSIASRHSEAFSTVSTQESVFQHEVPGNGMCFLWQWQYTVRDSCGESVVRGQDIRHTPSAAQPPCCLPGLEVNIEDSHQPNCLAVEDGGDTYLLCPPPVKESLSQNGVAAMNSNIRNSIVVSLVATLLSVFTTMIYTMFC